VVLQEQLLTCALDLYQVLLCGLFFQELQPLILLMYSRKAYDMNVLVAYDIASCQSIGA